MYYDKTQANTPISIKEWDHLAATLPFEMKFWTEKTARRDGEPNKDYNKRVLDQVIESTDDAVIQKLNKEGRVATLVLLSDPDTPKKVLLELRTNLEKVNKKEITSEQGTLAVFRGINPEELKKIQQAAIREHLAIMRAEDKKAAKASKMNVH